MTALEVLQWLSVPVVGGLIWAVWKTRDELTALKVHVAEKYVTSERLAGAENRIYERLAKIDQKLDELIQRSV
jgi:hypothetical protein